MRVFGHNEFGCEEGDKGGEDYKGDIYGAPAHVEII